MITENLKYRDRRRRESRISLKNGSNHQLKKRLAADFPLMEKKGKQSLMQSLV